jgi:hypothetical protein
MVGRNIPGDFQPVTAGSEFLFAFGQMPNCSALFFDLRFELGKNTCGCEAHNPFWGRNVIQCFCEKPRMYGRKDHVDRWDDEIGRIAQIPQQPGDPLRASLGPAR